MYNKGITSYSTLIPQSALSRRGGVFLIHPGKKHVVNSPACFGFGGLFFY